MCLDTGTPRSQLVDQAARESAEDAYAESRGVLGSGRSRRVRLNSLEVGGLSFDDLEVDLVPPDQAGARALLGLDVLGRRPFAFWPRQGRLVWEDEPPDTPRSLSVDGAGHLRLTVMWPGLTVRAVLDTGAGITVIDTDLAERWPQLFTGHGSAPGTDATGTTARTPTATVARGRLEDDLLLVPHRVAFTGLRAATAHLTEPIEVILGTPAIDGFDWWLDIPGRRWAATSSHRFPGAPAPSLA